MMAGPGLQRDQVVEVWVEEPGGPRLASFGSGYLVSPALVLTARHVVEPTRFTGAISVRFSAHRPDQPLIAAAEVAWAGTVTDIALLRVHWPEGEPSWELIPAAFGDLPDPAWQLPFEAMGYPSRKTRALSGQQTLRDCDQVSGVILAQRNVRSGMLDLSLTADPAGQGEAWSGFSGAAVFAHDFLIGVAIKAERVTAGFVAQRIAIPAGTSEELYSEFMEPADSVAEFRELLADDGHDLCVHPACRRSGYYSMIKKLLPKGGLLDRSAELGELRAFTLPGQGGGEVRPYADWVAAGWAGKTELAAQFVLDPPPGVDIVAFFVSRPLGEQTAQFREHACDQLAALVNKDPPPRPDGAAFSALWDEASTEAEARGRTLVLLIDGLDENDTQSPTIASLIPADIPAGPDRHQRVILIRRDPPGLDLAEDHPLRAPQTCVRKTLIRSSHAEVRRHDAGKALRDFLDETQAADALGLLAAAGPLRPAEVAALLSVENPSFGDSRLLSPRIQRLLQQAVGRGLLWLLDDGSDRYAFQHNALLQMTRAELGQDTIEAHEDAIKRWADGFADQGWPKVTPAYLMVGYPAFLARLSEVSRLAALTTPARMGRLRASTGDDAAAVEELTLALGQIASLDQPDLSLGCLLALRRETLLRTLARYPASLIQAHAGLGHWARAERLAMQLEQPADRAGALASIGGEAARAGQPQLANTLFIRALAAVAMIIEYQQRSGRMIATAVAAAAVHHLLDPRVVAAEFADPEDAVACLASFAQGYAAAGEVSYAEQFLAQARSAARQLDCPPLPILAPDTGDDFVIPGPVWTVAVATANGKHRGVQMSLIQAALAVARKAVESERLDITIRIAADLYDPIVRIALVREMNQAITGGPAGTIGRLLDDVQESTANTSGPLPQAALLCTLSHAFAAAGRAAAGLIRTATEIAARIEDHAQRALALGAVAQAVFATGQPADALLASAIDAAWLVEDDAALFSAQSATAQVAVTVSRPEMALRIANSIGDPVKRAWVRAAITYVMASIWEFGAVGALALDMNDPAQRNWAWGTVAAAAAASGQLGVAWDLAGHITDRELWDAAHAAIAQAAAGRGQIDEARQTIAVIADPFQRAGALSAVAQAVAGAGQIDTASGIVAEMPESGPRGATMSAIARAATATGQIDAALAIADRMTDARGHAWTLRAIAQAAAVTGQFAAAREAAAAITDLFQRTAARTVISQAACNAGDFTTARTTADEVELPDVRAGILAAIALARGAAPLGEGLLIAAREVASTVADPARKASTLGSIASAAAILGRTDLAAELVAEAEACAVTEDPTLRACVLAAMAQALAGAPDRAARLFSAACQAADQSEQVPRCQALAEIARYATGQAEWPERLSAESRRIALPADLADPADPAERSNALAALARAADRSGHHELAGRISRLIPIPSRRVGTLLDLAKSAALRDRPVQTDSLFAEALRVTNGGRAAGPSTGEPAPWMRADIAYAAASCRRLTAARSAAAAVTDEAERAELTVIIDFVAEIAGLEPEPDPEDVFPDLARFSAAQQPLSVVAAAVCDAGWLSTAVALAKEVHDRNLRGQLLVAIAEAAVATRDPGRALPLIQGATASVGHLDRSVRGRLLALTVQAAAALDPESARKALAVGMVDCFSADLVLTAADLDHQLVSSLAEELGIE
ncbi:MAG: trypsin-like peptidase domain-containing protein [Streptosporangiaceae bacterium]